MKSLSSVGLGLSIVFGCLLVALVAELYYLLWWKRRFTNRREIIGRDDLSSPAKELFYMLCLKNPSLRHKQQEVCSSLRITNNSLVNHEQESHNYDHHQVQGKEFVFRPFGDESDANAMEEGELVRLNSLSGPPRFLFTIVEETKEDLESEEGRSRGRSLSDLLLTVETPYLTPLASPPFFTPPLTPSMDSSSNGTTDTTPQIGSSTHLSEAEFNKIRSSPPPRFKFLQDAEEKLYRRTSLLAVGREVDDEGKLQIMKRVYRNQEKAASSSEKVVQDEQVVDGPFITITVDRYIEREVNSSLQVLPLPCSTSSMQKTQSQQPRQ